MLTIRVLDGRKLAPFLVRHMQIGMRDRDLRLDEFLRLALEKANEFVPSEAGMIVLDDPVSKTTRFREKNRLAVVACFGAGSRGILGRRQPASRGIAGRVYCTGEAYFSRDVGRESRIGLEVIGPLIKGSKKSVLCVPIAIRDSVVGALQLVNRKKGRAFTLKDFELLKIFADYISASIQNFLDAKRNADMARKDALTGLSNDRNLHIVLRKTASRSWRTGHDLTLLFMDLDHFKEVNDEHGHLAGSRVLAEVGYLLRENVNWPHAEIARYGGDEYVIVLPNADLVTAVETAENLRRVIERSVFLSKVDRSGPVPMILREEFPHLNIADKITASFGVASLQKHVLSADPNRLLRLADEAMYASKNAGRNRVTVASVAGGAKGRKAEVNH
jgi:diguanylate cyclase (GGDEF)-like protein